MDRVTSGFRATNSPISQEGLFLSDLLPRGCRQNPPAGFARDPLFQRGYIALEQPSIVSRRDDAGDQRRDVGDEREKQHSALPP